MYVYFYHTQTHKHARSPTHSRMRAHTQLHSITYLRTLCPYIKTTSNTTYPSADTVIVQIHQRQNLLPLLFPGDDFVLHCCRFVVFSSRLQLVTFLFVSGVDELFGKVSAPPVVVAATSPFEVSVGWVLWRSGAGTVEQRTGGAGPRYGVCDCRRTQSVYETLFPRTYTTYHIA